MNKLFIITDQANNQHLYFNVEEQEARRRFNLEFSEIRDIQGPIEFSDEMESFDRREVTEANPEPRFNTEFGLRAPEQVIH